MTTKLRINTPSVASDHPEYLRQCEFALEPSIVKVVEMASRAGWRRDQVAMSIAILAAQRWSSGGLAKPAILNCSRRRAG